MVSESAESRSASLDQLPANSVGSIGRMFESILGHSTVCKPRAALETLSAWPTYNTDYEDTFQNPLFRKFSEEVIKCTFAKFHISHTVSDNSNNTGCVNRAWLCVYNVVNKYLWYMNIKACTNYVGE